AWRTPNSAAPMRRNSWRWPQRSGDGPTPRPPEWRPPNKQCFGGGTTRHAPRIIAVFWWEDDPPRPPNNRRECANGHAWTHAVSAVRLRALAGWQVMNDPSPTTERRVRLKQKLPLRALAIGRARDDGRPGVSATARL